MSTHKFEKNQHAVTNIAILLSGALHMSEAHERNGWCTMSTMVQPQ